VLNQLHSEIDELERLRNAAKEIVETTIRKHIGNAVALTEDFPQAMVALAAEVEGELEALTTEAFDAGVGFSRERERIRAGGAGQNSTG